MASSLTPEQIQHWRNALAPILGPAAMFLPNERIQQIRDTMQNAIDEGFAKDAPGDAWNGDHVCAKDCGCRQPDQHSDDELDHDIMLYSPGDE